MTWLEFTEKVIGHIVTVIVAFAWPAAVAVLFVTQRTAIAALIDRVKKLSVGKDGVQVEAADKQLERVAANVVEYESAPKPILEQRRSEHDVPSTDVQALVESARLLNQHLEAYAAGAVLFTTKPDALILQTWKLVEDQLYRLANQEEPPPFHYDTGNELLLRVSKENLLDRKLLEAIAGLSNIYNETITGIMGWSPTQQQAEEFVANAAEVLKLMEPYMQVGYKGWRPHK